jgi:hypothetical protein
MSEQGIDAYRVLSVLGYCLLPMVGVGALSVIITLKYAIVPRVFGFLTYISQRHAGLHAILYIYCLVHLCRLWHLRCRSAHVRSAASCCLSRWPSIWLLCAAQRFRCWQFKVVSFLLSVPVYPWAANAMDTILIQHDE